MDHLRFSSRTSPFYVDDADALGDVIDVDLPPGWLKDQQPGWTFVWPEGGRVRTHGWKIHLSLREDDYEDSVRHVAAICRRLGASFKYVPSALQLRVKNAKNAERTASGKAVTIYPLSDAMLQELAVSLSRELAGRTGPYVLTDVRHGAGPVFFRHGAFVPLHVGTPPFAVPALPDSAGFLVADVREPGRVSGDGIELPPIVDLAMQAYTLMEVPSQLARYGALTPVHFSNAGGVYVSDTDRGRVVLKEARRGAGTDRQGRDAVERLVQEEANLNKLEGLGVAPRVIESFDVLEHRFLAIEYVDGETLSDRTVREHPDLRPDALEADRNEYFRQTSDLLLELGAQIARCHSVGVVVGDLHPSNLMVAKGGRIVLIDLEDDRPPEQRGGGAPFNALGYGAPPHLTAAQGDWFAFARVAASTLEPSFVREQLAPAWARTLMERMQAAFDPRLVELILNGDPSFGKGAMQHLFTPDDRVELMTKCPRDPDFIVEQLSSGIVSARRDDVSRPYPGDPLGVNGGARFAASFGLAGVLHGQLRRSVDVDLRDRALLIAGASSVESLGLLDGLTGVANVLARLGADEEAEQAVSKVKRHYQAVAELGLRGGRAGIAYGLLGLDEDFAAAALARLAQEVLERSQECDVQLSARPGLLDGWAGIAFALASAAHLDETGLFAEAGLNAWTSEARHLRRATSGGLGVAERDGVRVFPYLANGSAGLLIALAELRSSGIVQARDEAWTEFVHELVASCSHDAYVFDGLFHGVSGVMTGLRAVQPFLPEVDDVVDGHRRLLVSRCLSWRDSAHIVGDGLLRLSTDLATGATGALLALASAPTDWLPVWPSRDRATKGRR